MPERTLLLITNNSLAAAACAARCTCLCNESWSYGEVLVQARDYLHRGYLLLSHPWAGSLKPNQTPYKSLLLGLRSLDGQEPHQGLMLIEQALASYTAFQDDRPTPKWPEPILDDFREVDTAIIQSTLKRINL